MGPTTARRVFAHATLAAAVAFALGAARADDAAADAEMHHHHDTMDGTDGMQGDAHAHHHHMMQEAPKVTRSLAQVALPDVTLVRSDGAHVKLAAELDDGRPVLLDFIYTTCTTICPVMSQTFAEVQKRLGKDAAKIKMVSVSIDPEEDTPSRLREYSKRYGAGPQWSFYTGSAEASITVQRAFGAYRGDKMNHAPITYFRAAPGQPWVRLDGFATPDAVLSEVHTQVAQK